MLELYGEKVMLRPIEQADYDRIISWSKYDEIQYCSDGDYPTTVEECEEWVKRAESNRYQVRFGIVLNRTIIGDIELDQITWRSGDAELRIRIGERGLWDRGYGTDAVKVLLKYAFFNMNLSRIYLKVYTDNERAIRCYHKAGFKKEGRLTRETDSGSREIYLMRILKSEFERKQARLSNAG